MCGLEQQDFMQATSKERRRKAAEVVGNGSKETWRDSLAGTKERGRQDCTADYGISTPCCVDEKKFENMAKCVSSRRTMREMPPPPPHSRKHLSRHRLSQGRSGSQDANDSMRSDAKPKANFTTDYSAREASVRSEAVAADGQVQSSADEMNVATFATSRRHRPIEK